MNRWAQGGLARLDVFYRGAAGAPVDPPDPTLEVLDPDGATVAADLVPERDALGAYHLDWPVPLDAVVGTWSFVAGGTIDGAHREGADEFEVVLPGAVATVAYGTTLEDVKALVPGRRWTAESRPSLADVERFIESMADDVAGAIGPLPVDPDRATRLTGLAKRAVVLGAASHAEAAAHTERANPNDASSYAQWLWDRFLEARAIAVDYAELALEGGEEPAGVEPILAEPAWSFPEPVDWAARGI